MLENNRCFCTLQVTVEWHIKSRSLDWQQLVGQKPYKYASRVSAFTRLNSSITTTFMAVLLLLLST